MSKLPSTAIRVFVSSTFIDMQAERQYLVNEVFPQIRRRCALLGIDFEAIDLRWGVSGENSDAQVLDYCLEQIEGCLPYLLALIGGRYGWVPGTKPEIAPMLAADERECSVTELEIRRFERGVQRAGLEPRALVGLRSDAFTEELGVAEALTGETRARLAELRARFAPPGGFEYGDLASLGAAVTDYFIGKAQELANRLAHAKRRIDASQDEFLRLLRVTGVSHLPTALETRGEDGAWQAGDEEALARALHERGMHVVCGAPGSGKTALCTALAARWQEGSDGQVLRLHVGASGELSLNGVMRDLRALADARPDRSWLDALRDQINEASGPTLMVLDGVERIVGWDRSMLSQRYGIGDQAQQLLWTLIELLEADRRVSLLLTLDPEVQPDNAFARAMECSAIEVPGEQMPLVLWRIAPLDASRRRQFASAFFAFRGKQLTPGQLARIGDAEAADTFESLYLACDRLRRFGDLQGDRSSQDAFILERIDTIFDQSRAQATAALLAETRRAAGLNAATVDSALLLLAVTHYGLPAPVLAELVRRHTGQDFTLRDWAIVEGMFGPLLARSGTRYSFKNAAAALDVQRALGDVEPGLARAVLVDYLLEDLARTDIAAALGASLDHIFANELALQLPHLPGHPGWRELLAPMTLLGWLARDWEVGMVEFNWVYDKALFQQACDAADAVDAMAIVTRMRAAARAYMVGATPEARTRFLEIVNAAHMTTHDAETTTSGKARVTVTATVCALGAILADGHPDGEEDTAAIHGAIALLIAVAGQHGAAFSRALPLRQELDAWVERKIAAVEESGIMFAEREIDTIESRLAQLRQVLEEQPA